MPRSTLLRTLPAALALSLVVAAGAHAQSANPTGPGHNSTQKAGEAYPNDPNAANPNKPTLPVVERAAKSRPAQATKRATQRAANAVKRTGTRVAGAVRKTGEDINRRVPPGPNDAKQ